jgi:hypothetical protein
MTRIRAKFRSRFIEQCLDLAQPADCGIEFPVVWGLLPTNF